MSHAVRRISASRSTARMLSWAPPLQEVRTVCRLGQRTTSAGVVLCEETTGDNWGECAQAATGRAGFSVRTGGEDSLCEDADSRDVSACPDWSDRGQR